MSQNNHSHHQQAPDGPGGFAWFLQQVGWYLRKLVLWPVADSFRWAGSGIARLADPLRYRSPLAYIGGTLAVCVTAGAVIAAIHFRQQVETPAPATTVPEAAVLAETAVPVTVPAEPETVPATPAADAPETLQGVVPNFSNTAARKRQANGRSGRKTRTVVKASPAPKAGPLRTAHDFATAFVRYEVGEKQAPGRLKVTATPKLARELAANPPRLPVSGKVPKASVLNVVRGKRNGNRLNVSVALLRTGATSDLRLVLTRRDSSWRVSEVRG